MERSSHGQIRSSNSSTNHDILLKLKEVGWSDRWVSTMIDDYFLWVDGHLDSNQRSQDIPATAIRNNHRSSLKPTSPAIHLPTLVKYHCSLTTDRSSEFGLGICPWDEQSIIWTPYCPPSASARMFKKYHGLSSVIRIRPWCGQFKKYICPEILNTSIVYMMSSFFRIVLPCEVTFR